jgi:dihydrofolate synthase/folylpolyglutamate synthase
MDGDHLSLPRPALPGDHQSHNAGLAVAAARALADVVDLPVAAVAAGVAGAEWPARLQRLTRGPLPALLPAGVQLWLDGGHNPAAGQALARFMAKDWGGGPIDVIVGMLSTKDSRGFLRPLAPLAGRLRAVAIPGEANSLSADQVVSAARSEGLSAVAAASVAAAVADLAGGGKTGRILICGSLYLAGSVLAENG